MSYENNAKDQTLAREYKYLLSKIRPLIEQLDKSKDAQLCLLWLSKLDQCAHWEECERNEILCALSRQVKNKSLEPPFNSQPPPGPLKNITLHNSVPLSRNNDFCDDISSERTTETRSPMSSFSSVSYGGEECHQNRLIPWREKPLERNAGMEDHSRCMALQRKYHERFASDQLLLARYHDIIKSLIAQKLKNPATMKLKSLKTSYESKIYDLTTCLKMTQEENNCLREKLSSGSASLEKLQETLSRNEDLQEELKRLEVENSKLSIKCKELEMEKNTCLGQLAQRLSEAEEKLNERNDFINAMEKKYEENFRTCKTDHQKEVCELKQKYTCELSTLERILEEKQSEIGRLTEKVSKQSDHFEDKVSRLKHELLENHDLDKEKRKVKLLRSKLKRFNKNVENMSVAFQLQLEQIVSKKDLIISTLEMKLKSSDVDNSANGLYPGFDDIMSEKIRILEMQYRMLLEEAENQAAQRRQMDLQKILTLEKQLVDIGIGVENINSVPVSEDQQLVGTKNNVELIGYNEDNK